MWWADTQRSRPFAGGRGSSMALNHNRLVDPGGDPVGDTDQYLPQY